MTDPGLGDVHFREYAESWHRLTDEEGVELRSWGSDKPVAKLQVPPAALDPAAATALPPDHELRITPLGPLTTAKPCQLHTKTHTPNPHQNHFHHIWPLGDGGPNTADNRVVVCPTGHANIHVLLTLFKAYRGTVPYNELRTFSFGEREYALRGWQAIQASKQ